MADWMEIDDKEFKQFAADLHKAADGGFQKAVSQGVGRTTKVLVKSVQAKTPVDTGNLRRKWTSDNIHYAGHAWTFELINSADYASFVENGHRAGSSWVPGVFMMRDGVSEGMKSATQYLQKQVDKAVQDIFGG